MTERRGAPRLGGAGGGPNGDETGSVEFKGIGHSSIIWLYGACALASAAMAVAIAFAPGRGASAAVRLCAAATFALFLVAARRLSGTASPLREIAAAYGERSSRSYFMVAGAAIAGVAATVAGSVAAADAGDGFFPFGIAGFLASIVSVAAWSALLNGREGGADAPIAGSAVCGVVCAAGIGACFGMSMTPVNDTTAYALATGACVCAALWGCAWFMVRKSKMSAQLGALHDQLESAMTEKSATQQRLQEVSTRYEEVSSQFSEVSSRYEEVSSRYDEVSSRYDDLQARHEDEMRETQRLSAEVDSLRKRMQDGQNTGAFEEACAKAIEGRNLTPREKDVFMLLARGWSRKRIAEELVVEYSTVSSHVVRVYRKLDAHSNQDILELVESHLE